MQAAPALPSQFCLHLSCVQIRIVKELRMPSHTCAILLSVLLKMLMSCH